MKLRTKITMGFSLVILPFLIAVIFGVVSLSQASIGFVRYSELAGGTNLAGLLQANMLMVRMSVKDFVITTSNEAHEHFDLYYKSMEGYMQQALGSISEPERLKLANDANDKVGEYGEYFDKVVVSARAAVDIQTKQLDVLGPAIEKNLTSILESAEADNDAATAYGAATALRSVLLARLYSTKYINTSDPADIQRVHEEFGIADEHFAELDGRLRSAERRRLLAEAKNMSSQYISNFDTLTEHIKVRDDDVKNHLDRLGPLIAEDVDKVKLSMMAEQNELGPQIQANNSRTIVIVAVLSIAALGTALAIAFWTIASTLVQLGEDPGVIENIMHDVALGNLELNAGKEGSAKGVFLSVVNMVNALRDKADMVEQVANGDLTVDVRVASERDVLGFSLKRMTESLHELLSQVNTSIDQVNVGSDQVSQSSQSLSQGATEQASSLEEISSSLTEINSQAKQNAQNAKEANAIATQASSNASQGNALMQDLVTAMGEINTSSDEIQKVVKVIDDIAFQINLLALNANVEAARAGKYGKGFAVVAEEVRNLASRSAGAVKETTVMVEQTIDSITRGNASAEETAKQLTEIVDGSNKVATLLAEIAAASDEQASGIGQITQGLDQIDQVTQANTASAEESASAAEELASQATQLKSMIKQFKLSPDAGRTRQMSAPKQERKGISYKAAQPVKKPAYKAAQEMREVKPVNPKDVIDLESNEDFNRF